MLHVSDIMSSPVFSLSKLDNLLDVRQLMELANIRHIPITDSEGNFEGIVTHRDLLQLTISKLAGITEEEQDELDKGIALISVMRTDVRCVNSSDCLKDAAKILYEHKYGCLPVLEGKKLVGIITEADFLRFTITLIENLDD